MIWEADQLYRVAADAYNALDDTDIDPRPVEYTPLFRVELEVCRNVTRPMGGFT
jgi:hypothetical protein